MVSEGQNMTITPTADPSAPCWKDGCDDVRANLGTYYCSTHDRERRDRIARSMAEAAENVSKAEPLGAYQCAGINKNGTQCRRKGWSADGFLCHQHA